MNGKVLVIGIMIFFILFFVYESWLMRDLPHESPLGSNSLKLVRYLYQTIHAQATSIHQL